MKTIASRTTLTFVLSSIIIFTACHKAQVASPVPPPPPPAAPTALLAATPQSIEKGQSSTLSWQTTNAQEISIDAAGTTTETLGVLQPNGSLQVTPPESTTYTLYAKGPGGKKTASTRVTVTLPGPRPAAPSGPSEDELFAQNVKDIYFDFDRSEIRPDQQSTVERNAAFLSQHPNIGFTVEGHCDERGSIEYNLALGDRRSTDVKHALIVAGVSPANIKTFSYGKEKPVCSEHDESCWQQNRRGHFTR
jgi:peptidoglycan-associated lipoprotein